VLTTPPAACAGPGFELIGALGSDGRLVAAVLVGAALLLAGGVAVLVRLLGWIASVVEAAPTRWTAALRRIPGSQLFGLRVLVGLGASLGGAAAFIEIAEQVVGREDLARIDGGLAECLAAHATTASTSLWMFITQWGSLPVLGTIALAVTILLLALRQRSSAVAWVAALAGGFLLNLLLKELFQRPRPPGAAGILQEPSWSFPSGHAMMSLVAYGMIAYLIANATFRRALQLSGVFVASLMAVAIGISRLYLGVHYLTDVLAGYACGVLWLAVCVTAVELRRATRDPAAHASV
jgi:membrane-associated phospholipid phosphatase